jgi:hypothetical protein
MWPPSSLTEPPRSPRPLSSPDRAERRAFLVTIAIDVARRSGGGGKKTAK